MTGTSPSIVPFLHEVSGSYSYIVTAPGDRSCIMIDPVLDFDGPRARTGTEFADRLVAHVKENGLELAWILETHAHADRMSAAPYVKGLLGGRIGIGANIVGVQDTWNDILDLQGAARFDPSAFDALFEDGQVVEAGKLRLRVMHTPGHTPADAAYVVGDAAFIGDTLFMPDYGTARVDFPGGDAHALYSSVRRILALGDEMRLFMCHDYLTDTRKTHRCEVTVAEQKRDNIHVHDGIGEDQFVKMREARDRSLDFPKLLLMAVPFNLAGGRPPPAAANGTSYLKVPFNRF